MTRRRRTPIPTRSLIALLAAAATLALAGQAMAASQLWVSSDYGVPYGSGISVIPTDGSTGRMVFTESTSSEQIGGIALDPAHGKAFWFNSDRKKIRVGNLDGAGTATDLAGVPPHSLDTAWALTIDPTTQRLYWANGASGYEGIYWVATDGSSNGGPLFASDAITTSHTSISFVADPARGRLWWIDDDTGTARWASISGSGGVQTLPAPCGVGGLDALLGITPLSGTDTVWFNGNALGTYFLRLAGTDCRAELALEASLGFRSLGLAIDDASGRAYAANADSARLSGGNAGWFSLTDPSSATLLPSATGALIADSAAPVLLTAPVAPGGATITPASAAPGAALTCAATWQEDQPNQRAFHAPQSISLTWLRDGVVIAGATGSTYTPTADGTYECRASATNAAGTTSVAATAAVSTPTSPIRKLKASGSLRGRTFTSRGTVPRDATAVRIVASKGQASRTGRCRIAGPRKARTFTCTIKLVKGRWLVTTTATTGSTPVARVTRVVQVRK